MKPEPLIGKIKPFEPCDEYQCGYHLEDPEDFRSYVSEDCFKVSDVKSACEFYLKYKDKARDLLKDFPKYEKEFDRFVKPFKGKELPMWFIGAKYNEWLFKLAFKDVMEGDKK